LFLAVFVVAAAGCERPAQPPQQHAELRRINGSVIKLVPQVVDGSLIRVGEVSISVVGPNNSTLGAGAEWQMTDSPEKVREWLRSKANVTSAEAQAKRLVFRCSYFDEQGVATGTDDVEIKLAEANKGRMRFKNLGLAGRVVRMDVELVTVVWQSQGQEIEVVVKPEAQQESALPLPAELVAAWKEAGANVGWMATKRNGLPEFREGIEGKPGEVPAFQFKTWTDGVVNKLPQPQCAFGLSLWHTQVTDAGLKEFAGLKWLQTLDLGSTQVTDAGLRELVALMGLQTLVLASTQVTDAGLKEVAGLKGLQTLDIWDTKVSDAGLKQLVELNRLHTLNLGSTQVTDAGLKELARLSGLHTLGLGATQVTDAGLKELATRKGLRSLDLPATRITDSGLKELARLQGLQELTLLDTQITDAGLKELARIKTLQTLSLDSTRVTDAGLKEIAGLPDLSWLTLSDTKVTDAGLKELSRLQGLHTLVLSDTQVTDAGLMELAGLKRLQRLAIVRTQVTDGGVAELKKALPMLQILR
jgi:hypothetical protein